MLLAAHVAQGTHVIFVVRHGCGERGRKCAAGGEESARVGARLKAGEGGGCSVEGAVNGFGSASTCFVSGDLAASQSNAWSNCGRCRRVKPSR